jgi:hypothetical protein
MLGEHAAPVKPLASPMRRALATLAGLALVGAIPILLFGWNLSPAADGKALLMLEMAAMLATGVLAIAGAFHLAVPGSSRWWLAAPLVPFAAWLMLSGMGCYETLLRGTLILAGNPSSHCFLFILGVGALFGLPLLWRLSRAAPIDPVPVALLGGLGSAALGAFLLRFFHPLTITFLDLAFHLAAILVVVGLTALLRRPMLRPA